MSVEAPHACPTMEWALSDERAPFIYDDLFREHAIMLSDESQLTMEFCPFCGTPLPPSLRDEWFERLDRLGLEPEDPRVPAEMRDGTWWRASAT